MHLARQPADVLLTLLRTDVPSALRAHLRRTLVQVARATIGWRLRGAETPRCEYETR